MTMTPTPTLALRGARLTVPGACTPALTEREYALVRLAIEVAS